MRAYLFPTAAFGIATLLFAAGTKADYSHPVDFGNCHTYSWLKVDAGNGLWVDRIKRDINEQLTAKGWMELPSGREAAVSAFGATHNQQSLQTFYDGCGGEWGWRGTSEKTLSDKPDKNENKLEDQLSDMFKHFPPPAKG